MAQFLLAYHPGPPEMMQNADPDSMARWQAWLKDLGDAVVDPGTPLGKSKTISKEGVVDGGGANPLMGFTVVQAASVDEAIAMAERCPFLEMGTIELAEMMSMPA